MFDGRSTLETNKHDRCSPFILHVSFENYDECVRRRRVILQTFMIILKVESSNLATRFEINPDLSKIPSLLILQCLFRSAVKKKV